MLIRPTVMVPPLLWLASQEADETTSMRYIACDWDVEQAPGEAAKACGTPAAWPGIGGKSKWADAKFSPSGA